MVLDSLWDKMNEPPRRKNNEEIWMGGSAEMVGESHDPDHVRGALDSFLKDTTIPEQIRNALETAVEERVKKENTYLVGFSVSKRGHFYTAHLHRMFRGKNVETSSNINVPLNPQ